MYTIFVDTNCDMTPELCNKYGFKLIRMPYIVNGKEITPYADWKEFNFHEYYDMLRKGVIPTTFALSPENYKDFFEPEFKKGNDILYIHFSGAMSGTFNAMRLAIEELKEKYPERQFNEIDTLGMTIGGHYVARQLGELYLQGKSVDELLEWAKTGVQQCAFYFYADDLKFFGKSGRVSGFAAFMGGIIGIRPIIYIDEHGVMTTKEKTRGYKNSLNRLLQYVIDLEDHIEDYPVYIGHSDALEIADEFTAMLQEKFGNKLHIEYVPVNPTAGAHCGPNAIGVAFHAKHR